jgi:hypothetical protein
MTGWDDLPDDVQDVVSAFVRRNLEAELAEEAIRLQSLIKETVSKLLKWKKGGTRGSGSRFRESMQVPAGFVTVWRFSGAQQAEAEFRASERERVRKLKESLFGGVPEKEIRRELCRAFTAYVDRCTAAGIKPELTRPFLY